MPRPRKQPPEQPGGLTAPPPALRRRGIRTAAIRFTPEQRALVQDLAQYGMPQDRICRHIRNPHTGHPIAEQSLRVHFREALDIGYAAYELDLMKCSKQMAMGMPELKDAEGNVVRPALPPDKAVLIFLLKTRLGLSEKITFENTTPEEPDEFTNLVKNLSRDELRQLKAILAKPAGPLVEGSAEQPESD